MFVGNSDQETVKTHCLNMYYSTPIVTRSVKITLRQTTTIRYGIRIEFYGRPVPVVGENVSPMLVSYYFWGCTQIALERL